VPFTVKMRSGWDPQNKNCGEIARMCEEEGVDAVAIHWRTRQDKYGGDRELDTIAAVKAERSIPVIANGDIIDVASATETLRRTGCDGLMIGRGAIRDPWLFRRIQADMFGLPEIIVDANEKERVLIGYFDEILERFRSEKGALGRMKKICRYFTEGLPHGHLIRQAVFHSHSVAEARNQVGSYFDKLRILEAGEANPFVVPASVP
jgi:tRNA-dihydrouridine synthase B